MSEVVNNVANNEANVPQQENQNQQVQQQQVNPAPQQNAEQPKEPGKLQKMWAKAKPYAVKAAKVVGTVAGAVTVAFVAGAAGGAAFAQSTKDDQDHPVDDMDDTEQPNLKVWSDSPVTVNYDPLVNEEPDEGIQSDVVDTNSSNEEF